MMSITTNTRQKSPRRHDLDALRAIAMLLGIILHTALSFVQFPWLVQSTEQHEGFGLLFSIIHGFRMPLFFVMSGFFTAMLWRKRGLRSLVQHRFRRVFLPLLLALLTIVPLINWVISIAIGSTFGQLIEAKTANVEGLWSFLMVIPFFHHLWFLWHLTWLVAAFTLIVLLARRLSIPKVPDWLVLSPARYLWLVPLTMIPQAFMGAGGAIASFGPDTSVGLLPMPHVLAYYAIFFGFGALYYGYDDPDGRISKWWWLVLPLGLLIIFPLGLNVTFEDHLFDAQTRRYLSIFLQAIYPWVLTFGLMGLFGKLFAHESKTMRYLSDSSYWLYLAHLPLVIVAQIVVREWQLSDSIKFTLICVVITAFLLWTYETLVRYRWLGTFLNGPRQRGVKQKWRFNVCEVKRFFGRECAKYKMLARKPLKKQFSGLL